MPSSNTFSARRSRVARLTVCYSGSMSTAASICGENRPCPITHLRFVRNWLTGTRRDWVFGPLTHYTWLPH